MSEAQCVQFSHTAHIIYCSRTDGAAAGLQLLTTGFTALTVSSLETLKDRFLSH